MYADAEDQRVYVDLFDFTERFFGPDDPNLVYIQAEDRGGTVLGNIICTQWKTRVLLTTSEITIYWVLHTSCSWANPVVPAKDLIEEVSITLSPMVMDLA